MEATDGLSITLGATTLGLVVKEFLAWFRSRNQKTEIGPSPLPVEETDKFITRGESITASGVVDGKNVSLRLSTTSLDAANTSRHNDNALFVDGAFTPLPPVCITHPFGIAKDWNAQDYESMVDLSFVPQNSYSRKANFILVNASYDTVFGFLNGTVMDSSGAKHELRDFPAVVHISRIRL